jgi:hypothetical protein
MLKKANVTFTECNILDYMKYHHDRWVDAVASMRLEGLQVEADNPTVPILIVREGHDIAVIPSEFIDDHTIERIAGCRQC